MCRTVAQSLATYAEWAPAGWTPAPGLTDPGELAAWWTRPGFVAWVDADVTAHVASHWADDEPGAFHLVHLFVRPSRFGTGVASALHARALQDARAAGAHSIRLRTPSGNARGLAFYRREGWGQQADAGWAPHLGLHVVWLRRAL